MLSEEYKEFVDKFEELSPYELDHLCHMILKHYKTLINQSQQDGKEAIITDRDFKEIMIHTMQATQIELAEQHLKDAELNLQLVKSKIYIKVV